MRLYELFQSGGPVMWPLLACSLLALTATCERFQFWARIGIRRDRKLLDELLRLAEGGAWSEIREMCRECNDPVVRMLEVGILHREYDMGKAMEAEAQHRLSDMSRYMTILDTMITVTPLLGILGTVLGIIASFKMLGAGAVTDPKLVTGGIAQALITTAAGLTISIATVFPYNYFKSRIEHAAHILEKYATSLELVAEKLDWREKG